MRERVHPAELRESALDDPVVVAHALGHDRLSVAGQTHGGKWISRRSLMVVAPFGRRLPVPAVSVAHSTPSVVRIAARAVGAVRNAAAACD